MQSSHYIHFLTLKCTDILSLFNCMNSFVTCLSYQHSLQSLRPWTNSIESLIIFILLERVREKALNVLKGSHCPLRKTETRLVNCLQMKVKKKLLKSCHAVNSLLMLYCLANILTGIFDSFCYFFFHYSPANLLWILHLLAKWKIPLRLFDFNQCLFCSWYFFFLNVWLLFCSYCSRWF